MAGHARGLLQSPVADRTVRVLMTPNKVLRKRQQMTELRLRFPSCENRRDSVGDVSRRWFVPPARRLFSIPNSSGARQEVQHMSDRKHAFIEWSSRRIECVVRSSLAAEVHGLSMGLDSAVA